MKFFNCSVLSHGSLSIFFLRPEIFMEIQKRESKHESLRFIADEVSQNGILAPKTLVFMNTIPELNDVFFWLRDKTTDYGRLAVGKNSFTYMIEMFSGSTNARTKSRIMSEFVKPDSTIRVLIATVAFGMGVNVQGLTRVVVYKIPDSVSILWQEIGRASRGGQPGSALILVPQNPTEASLGHSLLNTCLREAILKQFTGYQNTQRVPCTCGLSSCSCYLCNCCTFCKLQCVCKENNDQ